VKYSNFRRKKDYNLEPEKKIPFKVPRETNLFKQIQPGDGSSKKR
jgi:hypothetical protein